MKTDEMIMTVNDLLQYLLDAPRENEIVFMGTYASFTKAIVYKPYTVELDKKAQSGKQVTVICGAFHKELTP